MFGEKYRTDLSYYYASTVISEQSNKNLKFEILYLYWIINKIRYKTYRYTIKKQLPDLFFLQIYLKQNDMLQILFTKLRWTNPSLIHGFLTGDWNLALSTIQRSVLTNKLIQHYLKISLFALFLDNFAFLLRLGLLPRTGTEPLGRVEALAAAGIGGLAHLKPQTISLH